VCRAWHAEGSDKEKRAIREAGNKGKGGKRGRGLNLPGVHKIVSQRYIFTFECEVHKRARRERESRDCCCLISPTNSFYASKREADAAKALRGIHSFVSLLCTRNKTPRSVFFFSGRRVMCSGLFASIQQQEQQLACPQHKHASLVHEIVGFASVRNENYVMCTRIHRPATCFRFHSTKIRKKAEGTKEQNCT